MIVNIHTDAGYDPVTNTGSYAYWIEGANLLLTGHGLIDKPMRGSWQAEMTAIIMALRTLHDHHVTDIQKIFIHRDNVSAKVTHGKFYNTQLECEMVSLIKKIFMSKHVAPSGDDTYLKQRLHDFYRFKHVKGHNGKSHSQHTVINKWCDKMCTLTLKQNKNGQKLF